MDRCAREVAHKGILIEEHRAMVLGDNVEVLRQGTVSNKACTFLHSDHMPRAIEVCGVHGSDPVAGQDSRKEPVARLSDVDSVGPSGRRVL